MSKVETPNSKEGIEILEGIENWSGFALGLRNYAARTKISEALTERNYLSAPGLEDEKSLQGLRTTQNIRAEIADAGPEVNLSVWSLYAYLLSTHGSGSAQYIANLRKALKKHTWKTTDTPTAYINRGKSMFDALNEAKSCEFTNELQLCSI
ncbi:hypothetical protein BC829DRAFT_447940 [Chytridium lagenaria]|nr:hypothetical protein BC829DRAFT_447940 [Chytridium lagenaria]